MANNINNKQDSFLSNKKFMSLTNLDEMSNTSKSKMLNNNLNDSTINFSKKKFNSRKTLLNFKKLPSINHIDENDNNIFPPLNFNKNFHNISPNVFSSTHLSKSQISMKSIEKDLQQKIINISLKIEEESTIIGIKNPLKLSTLIMKKINFENKDNLSIFSPKHNRQKGQKSLANQKAVKFEEKKDTCLSPKKNNLSKNNKFTKHLTKKFTKKFTISKAKYRTLLRKKMVYDSFDSEEDDEIEGIYISPDNSFIHLIDSLIIIFSFIYMIYTPYLLSNIKSYYMPGSIFIRCIYYFIDILYIIDLILGFFRAHQNYQFQIIKNNKEIIKHYLLTQFFLDLIEAIPFFSFIFYYYEQYQINLNETYNIGSTHLLFLLCCYIKVLKFFKIIDIKKNSIYNILRINISDNDLLEKIFSFCIYFCLGVFGFYFFISIHILIGRSSFPNWIINSGFENENLFSLYLISFYYLITTMTTVGYGNIVCASTFREYFFQLILLSAGITLYSWIVSNIGNYVKNESNASIRFDKDEAILEDIRILYPNMPFTLYKKIYHHLGLRKIRQRQCDSNLLINSLPHSLKNEILFSMHKLTIKNFKIFKGNQNTDFTIRLLTNFIPLISKKNAFLIHEGQLINNIIFVQEGRLALEACINIEEPYKSVTQYINKNFCDIFEDVVIVSDYETSFEASKLTENNYNNIYNKAQNELNTVLNDKNKTVIDSSINESNIIKEIGKWDFGGDGEIFESNFQFLNIINISKNESFGDVYMFLCKPSPLFLRVKSKIAALFLLRRIDASDISSRYPNIWAKFFKKSYKNMLSIKALTIKKIKYYWKNLGKHYNKDKKHKEEKIDFSESKENKNSVMMKSIIPKICISNVEPASDNKNTFIFGNNQNNQNNQNKNSLFLKTNDIRNANSIKYISFGKESSKHLDKYYNSCMSSRKLKMESNIKNEKKRKLNTDFQQNNLRLSKFRSDNKNDFKNEIKNIDNKSAFSRNKTINDIRIGYLNKLNRKIEKLKISKKYYKDLCKKFKNNLNKKIVSRKSYQENNINLKHNNNFNELNENKSYNSDKINNINISINFNNNNVILDKAEINISKSSISNSNSSSNSKLSNNLSIESPMNFSFQAKYKNLENLTLGEYSKNRNLRNITQKFIQFYLSSFPKNKKEKKFLDPNLSIIKPIKSSNVDYGLTSYTSLYSDKKKINIPKKNLSYNSLSKYLSKQPINNLNEGQYLLIFDRYNNSFSFLGKNNNKKRLSVPIFKQNFSKEDMKNSNQNYPFNNGYSEKNNFNINEINNKMNIKDIEEYDENEKEFNIIYNNKSIKTFET